MNKIQKSGINYPKLTDFDKAIYVYDEIIQESKEYGRHIPIKIIVRAFSKDFGNGTFIISKKEIIEIISKIEETGCIYYSRKGYLGVGI